jgi:hypothetical protein
MNPDDADEPDANAKPKAQQRKSRLTAQQRTEQAREKANIMHARHDPKDTTKAAQAASWLAYLDQVDPTRSLSEDERQRLAAEARSDRMSEISNIRWERERKRKARRRPRD